MQNKSFFTKLMALVFGAFIGACSSPDNSIQDKIKETLEQHQTVGLAVVVVQDNEIVLEENYGFKDLENEIPLEKGDLFRIASISKSFTSTSLLQLVEKGILNLNDDVGDLIGFEVRNPDFPDTPISLQMILSHSSSLNDSRGYFTLDTLNPNKSEGYKKSYNDYEPGTKYEYSNLNYNLAGAILEKWSEQNFNDYVVEHVLQPLGIKGGYDVDHLDQNKFVTLYEYDSTANEFTASPDAYASRKAEKENYQAGYDTPIYSPTGGLKISARDLARYLTLHMNKGQYKDQVILSPESADLMQRKLIKVSEQADYGLGLFNVRNLIPNKNLIGHTGSAYGLYSTMFFDPEENLGIIAITNGTNKDVEVVHDYTPVLHAVIQLLYKHYTGVED